MNEKTKIWFQNNWFKVGLLIFLIISIGGAFYWYEWRPSEIRKECVTWAKPSAKLLTSVNDFQILVNICLQQYGLAK
jgi:predicted negative regulator of RcsB-dependent stress response